MQGTSKVTVAEHIGVPACMPRLEPTLHRKQAIVGWRSACHDVPNPYTTHSPVKGRTTQHSLWHPMSVSDREADENSLFTGETPSVLLYRAGQKGIGLVAANNLRLVAALFDQQKLEITHREQMERRYL
jgi:hypothetical protein